MIYFYNAFALSTLVYSLYSHFSLKEIEDGRKTNETKKIAQMANELAKQMGVSKKISVSFGSSGIVSWIAHDAAAFSGWGNKAGISIDESYYSMLNDKPSSQYLFKATLAHEIAHIKNQDVLTLALYHATSQLFINALNQLDFSNIALTTCFLVSVLGGKYLLRHIEQNADLEASKYLTDYEKIAVIEEYKHDRVDEILDISQSQMSFIRRFWMKFKRDEAGRKRFSLFESHPPEHIRIERIRETMEDKTKQVNFKGLKWRAKSSLFAIFINEDGFIRGKSKRRGSNADTKGIDSLCRSALSLNKANIP